MAQVLITGGSGYFGSLLLQRLRSQSSCRIFDLVDAPDRPNDVDFVQGDIRDFEIVRRACRGVQIVHHNVAQVPLAKDRRLFESVNVEGTRNLLEAAKLEGVSKVVYTSSSAVFGAPKTNPVTEDTEPAPGEAYGRAKFEAEKICHRYADGGLDVSIIRPRTILGHGRLGIFQILFEWIRTGFNVPVLGKGDNIYQFVHADDLAEACRLAGERRGARSYNIGAARFGSMRQALEALCRHAGAGSRVRSVPMTPAVWAMKLTSVMGLSPLGAYHALMYGRSMYFDISRARAELAWEPRWGNDEMVIDSFDWYVRNRERVLTEHGLSHHRSAVKQGILNFVKRVI
jgi:nucleoside-diphosphate-sugar epimerase